MTRRYALVVVSYIVAALAVASAETTTADILASAVEKPETVERATCVNQVRLEFEYGGNGVKLNNGQFVSNQWYASQGITVTGSGSGVQVLNTANPGGNQYLGSPNRLCSKPGPGLGVAGGPTKAGSNCKALGNVLYVAGKYYVSRTIRFEFSQPRYLQSIGVLDIKQGAQVVVTVQTSTGQVVTVAAAGLGDNAVQVVGIYKTGVKAVTIRMMTGAVTHLDFCKSAVTPTVTAPVAPRPVPTSTVGACQKRTYIGFDVAASGAKLTGGQYVMNEWLAYGVSVLAYAIGSGFSPLSKPRIFDTSNPGTVTSLGSPNKNCPSGGPGVGMYGQPGQLGQNCIPLGKVLIVQQGSVSTPDASTSGAVFTFRFTTTKTVLSMGLFSVPLADTAVITVTLADGSKKLFYAKGMGKNGYQTVNFNWIKQATKVTVFLPTSGAISHIDLCGSTGNLVGSPVSTPTVQSRVDGPSPLSIPLGTNPPSPYATFDDNGMFRPNPSVPISNRNGGGSRTTPAPSPYATFDDNGMFRPHV